MKFSVFLLSALVILPSEGFLGPVREKHPSLSEFAQAQTGILLNIGLDIPKDKDATSSRLYIRDLALELQTAQFMDDHVGLPGASGPNPTCSTGPLTINVREEGKFVSMQGVQTVPFEKACWEMLWLKDRPAGSIVCGFELPEDVSRNGAILPAGGVYISFPIFTAETLEVARAKKIEYETNYKKHTDLQDQELKKMNSSKNPFMKLVHFRNAVDANQHASLMRTNVYDNIPTSEEDLIRIADNLILCKDGKVFTKSAEHKGKKDHKHAGKAILSKFG